MPVTLSMYFYRVAQEKIQKEFEKSNRLLDWDDIDNIVQGNDPNDAVDIFYSAVVDHHPVDGKPCYLLPPVPPWMAHDDFKRAYIAYALGKYVGRLDEPSRKNVVQILRVLASKHSCGYVQILSWCTLAQWMSFKSDIFNSDLQELLVDALGGTIGALIGPFVFLEKMFQQQYGDALWPVLERADNDIRYNVQQAMWRNFLNRHRIQLGQKNMTPNINKNLSVSMNNFCAGASLVGLSGIKPEEIRHGNSQLVQVARFLQKQSGFYVSLAGRCYQQCWEKR